MSRPIRQHSGYEDQAHADNSRPRILILIPSALFLASKASIAEFDIAFYTVQAIELTAGAANIALLGLNMRDGLKMKGRLRYRSL